MRIRTVAKEGALAAFAASKPRVQSRQSDFELEAAKAEIARLSEAGQADGRPAHPGRGKRRLGLSLERHANVVARLRSRPSQFFGNGTVDPVNGVV